MAVARPNTDDPYMGDLGRNLREARERLELTQEQIADRSGVHATEVSRIEAGKRDPQLSTIQRLAEAVELTPGQLLDLGQLPGQNRQR
jgi:transcriptional regulator with XRE-family HTH domain